MPTRYVLIVATNGSKTGSLAHLSQDGRQALCSEKPHRPGFRYIVAPGYQNIYGICAKCFRLLGEGCDPCTLPQTNTALTVQMSAK